MSLAVFIPVRLSSSRLPGKAMMEIKGKPLFQYLVERVRRAKEPDSIILCTTTNPIDDDIVSLAKTIRDGGYDAIITTAKDWYKIEPLLSVLQPYERVEFFWFDITFAFLTIQEHERFFALLTDTLEK